MFTYIINDKLGEFYTNITEISLPTQNILNFSFYFSGFQLLRDTDLAMFSQGAVRHNLSVLKIKFWSDVDHINQLCETQSPR